MKVSIFDLDGVIWRGKQVLPYAAETVQALTDNGHAVYYMTNNSRLKRSVYVNLLHDCGIDAGIDQILTSGYACRLYLEDKDAQGKACFAIGGSGLVEELEAAGLTVDTESAEIPTGVGGQIAFSAVIQASMPTRAYDYVAIGLDKDFNYAKMATAQAANLDGAEFIASNTDATFPAESGRLMPGCGALIASLIACTGKQPIVCGKPEPLMLDVILKHTGAAKSDVTIIGDRIDSDILMANLAGINSILVLTGVTTLDDLETAPDDQQPQRIFEGLGPDLVEALE